MYSETRAGRDRFIRVCSVWDTGTGVLLCMSEHSVVGTFFTQDVFLHFLRFIWVAVKTAFVLMQAGKETGLVMAGYTTVVAACAGTSRGRYFDGGPAAAGERRLFLSCARQTSSDQASA